MKIQKVITDKKQYLDLLLLADEQENMIDRYLEHGTMYVLNDNGVIVVCVVIDEGNKSKALEIKNIAVKPEFQRMGYGKAMLDFITKKYKNSYDVIQVGTGEVPAVITFYEKCGFIKSHKIKNFFTDNYDHEIYEDSIQLVDMIYLKFNNQIMENTFFARIERFSMPCGWHYVLVPAELSIAFEHLAANFGYIAITAKVGNSSWSTSLLPMGNKLYFIALPAKVRLKEKLSFGDEIEISFEPRVRK